jgi:hypothetical protein
MLAPRHNKTQCGPSPQKATHLPGRRYAILILACSAWWLSPLMPGACRIAKCQPLRLQDDIDSRSDPRDGNVLGVITDYDDLHVFNFSFDWLGAAGLPYSGAVDAVNIVWLGDSQPDAAQDDSHIASRAAEALRMRDWQFTGIDRGAIPVSNDLWPDDVSPIPATAAADLEPAQNGIGLIYGLRAIERQDGHYFWASGGLLNSAQWQTVAENHIIGPQLGVVMQGSAGPLSVRFQATALAGFNYGDVHQSGELGRQRQIPGAINQLLFGRPTVFNHVASHDEFSPSGELLGEATFRLTDSAAIVFTWSGIAIGNVLLSENRTRSSLPDMGLIDPGIQSIFVHSLFCGVHIVR